MGAEDSFETTIVDSIVTDNQVSVAPSVVDTAIQNATQNTVTIDATQSAATTDTITTVVLPLTSMETMADNTMDLEVKLSGDAVVKLDNKALQSLLDQAEGTDITLVVEQVKAETLTDKQQKQLKNKKVGLIISAQLLSDGKAIWTQDDNQNANKDGSITISVPFTPPEGTKGEHFSIYYVDDDGNMTKMPTKFVDGALQFTTWHFSDYVALEDEEPEATAPGTGSNTPEPEPTTPETEPTTPETEATKPDDGIVNDNPQTGDLQQPVLFAGLMLTCALAVVMLIVLRKKSYI